MHWIYKKSFIYAIGIFLATFTTVVAVQLVITKSQKINETPDDIKTEYTILASTSGNGSISPEGKIFVTEGSEITFTITPATNYHISSVVIDSNLI
jgi:hypothetical protein